MQTQTPNRLEERVSDIKKISKAETALKSAAKGYRNARLFLEGAKTTDEYKAGITAVLVKHAILGNAAIAWANAEDKYNDRK